MQFQIESEFEKLEAVLVHRPGVEIDRLTHDNMRRFLFEDVPYLRRMQEEHDAFVGRLRDSGVEVVFLRDLLCDVLRDDAARKVLLESVCRTAGVPAIAEDLGSLSAWNIEALADILLGGVTAAEYADATGRRVGSTAADDSFLLPPVPNAYFSRDPAVVVGGAAISSKMHYRERIRETLLVRCVLENHPEFRANHIVYGGSDEPTEDRPYAIEGGDVLVLSADALLVGCSERTRSETIERLAGKCFQLGHIKRVYEIPVPSERAFMHLDTVFTILDRGKVLWFPEVMENVRYVERYEADDAGMVRRTRETRSFQDVLRDEFGCDLTIMDTAGGRKPFAAREQRMDGSNALAIAPSVAITYERNEHTTRELEAHGVTCLGIDDSELVRGLGGPRCMTMPLRRAIGS